MKPISKMIWKNPNSSCFYKLYGGFWDRRNMVDEVRSEIIVPMNQRNQSIIRIMRESFTENFKVYL